MTRLEYLNCRVLTADTGREAPDDGVGLLPPRRLERRGHRELPRALRQLRQAHPRAARQLPAHRRRRGAAHRRARLARHRRHRPFARARLPVLPGPEAADLAATRCCRASRPTCRCTRPSPTPTRWPTGWPRWHKIKAQVPDDVLVLPSHNECFRGLHARLDYLRRGAGAQRWRGCASRCAEPRRAGRRVRCAVRAAPSAKPMPAC